MAHGEKNRALAKPTRRESPRATRQTTDRRGGEGDGQGIHWGLPAGVRIPSLSSSRDFSGSPNRCDDRALRPKNTRGRTQTRNLPLRRDAPYPLGLASGCGSHGGRPTTELTQRANHAAWACEAHPLAGLEPAIFGLEVRRLVR
jgi:hypothetical protein